MLCAFNFTPIVRHNVRLGVPTAGHWNEVLNTDAPTYGGSGQGNFGGQESMPIGCQGQPRSVVVTLPPLAAVFFSPAT